MIEILRVLSESFLRGGTRFEAPGPLDSLRSLGASRAIDENTFRVDVSYRVLQVYSWLFLRVYVLVGTGMWSALKNAPAKRAVNASIPAPFATLMAPFLNRSVIPLAEDNLDSCR